MTLSLISASSLIRFFLLNFASSCMSYLFIAGDVYSSLCSLICSSAFSNYLSCVRLTIVFCVCSSISEPCLGCTFLVVGGNRLGSISEPLVVGFQKRVVSCAVQVSVYISFRISPPCTRLPLSFLNRMQYSCAMQGMKVPVYTSFRIYTLLVFNPH
jgi:hypothetical protein